jgi:glucose/arabinose dehydrogenase
MGKARVRQRCPNRGLVRLAACAALFAAGALLAPSAASPPGPAAASAGVVPPGFVETTVFSGLTNPTVVRFASDGRVFVAEKSGLIKVFDNLSDTTPTVFADLRTNVHNFWDRGLLGMTLHPSFPGTPYVYVLYTYDHVLGDAAPAPRWGSPGATSDGCPSPPGPTSDGCVVSGRLSRLEASGSTMTGPEQVLIEDWCQQYPSHSVGTVDFGPDGALYATSGDGASFNFADWGQDGSPLNPCGDPPGGVGATLTPPTAEGGALRSQDLRTPSDPVSLDGSVIRVDPATGAALPSNPLSGSSDPNARRIVAYGLRNPFRFTFRPGTGELWLGDVGWGEWEEINRIVSPADATVENFGWPCYEGNPRQGGYDGANLSICENLYAQGNADTKPYHAYHHNNKVVTGETCPTGSSSIAGLAFEFAPQTSSFPSEYQGALFFADYSRDCIWVMRKGGNPHPSPGHIDTFVAGASNPVNLEFGPDGNLYYADFDGGTVHRVAPQDPQPSVTGRTPTPGATLVPTGASPTATFSEAMDPATLTTSTFTLLRQGNPTPVPATVSYANLVATLNPNADLLGATTYTATVKGGPSGAKDLSGNPLATDVSWSFSTASAANQAPAPTITTPAAGVTWKVGDTLAFSGTATDPEQGTLPATALSWRLLLQHCPSNCHTHTLQTWTGVASGSFAAPDHEYPSYLDLELTATDSSGASTTTTRRLNPQTVTLDFASSPPGLQLAVNSAATATPFSRTVIRGSTNTVSATSPQSLGATTYVFSSWSDGGAQTHTITANASATYTATYTPQSGGAGYAASVLADSPLAYWRLGEASGTSAADASGNNRTGTYLNTPSLGAPGALAGDANSAVSFNGSDEHVNVPYTAALNPSSFTVEAWVYPTGGQGSFRSIVTSRDYAPGQAKGYVLYAAPDNRWQLWTGSGGWNVVYGPAVVLNQWTHLVGTYDGSTLRLYVNGALVASSVVAYTQNTTRPLRIAAGRTESPAQYFLPGRVDEVALYGAALSAARVSAHYAAASG